MIKIYTERLMLLALEIHAMRLLTTSRTELETHLGLNHSSMEVDPFYQCEIDNAMKYLLEKMEAHPEAFPWYSPWEIVLRETNTVIGGIGFVGPPDENGVVNFGYHIDQNRQRKGYATEAVEALVRWAMSYETVKAVQATTLPENVPSQHVLLKNGFLQTGEGEDEGRRVIVFTKMKVV